MGLTGIGSVVGVYAYYARELPPPSEIESAQNDAFQTTVLYDRTGQHVLYEIVPTLGGDRQWASIYEVPQYFLDATVAIEDSSFYTNPGFDLRGITRAMWTNLNGGMVQGASTITQQLVRNVLLTEEERNERTFDRKTREIILASEISRLYSKDQILEWYINTNFYGNLAYGIEAAARIYFDKPARELTLGEAAMLAAIPQFPRQNPIDNPDAARLRQQLVLQRMVNLGYITQEQMNEALSQPIILGRYSERFDITAPHFSLYARSEAETILNQLGLDGSYLVSRGGLRIYTTLDLDLQQQLECVSRTHVMRLDGAAPDFVHNTHSGQPCAAASYLPPLSTDMQGMERHVTNAAGVILKAETSEIVAMIGSVDFWNKGIDGNFNVATAERQPGSVFKPIVYMTAFLNPIDNGTTIVTPATMTTDVRMEFNNGGPEPYVPQNIDLRYHGPVSIREALANSYNVPVVQVLNWVGLSKVIQTAHRLGINSLDEGINAYGLSLALGAGETTLLDMAYVYNVFNNLGYATGTPVHASVARPGYRQLNPVSILRIEDAEGKILWEYSEAKGTFDRRLIIPQGMAYI
ncbi:MAG: transglycosylase domain-containing protein, partial [Anaerolineae bacterium]|nr:transglycosylase domain-containing protein [Anaerolineae bacterium]